MNNIPIAVIQFLPRRLSSPGSFIFLRPNTIPCYTNLIPGCFILFIFAAFRSIGVKISAWYVVDRAPRYIGRRPFISEIKLFTLDMLLLSSPHTNVSTSRLCFMFLNLTSEIVWKAETTLDLGGSFAALLKWSINETTFSSRHRDYGRYNNAIVFDYILKFTAGILDVFIRD
jgi:hypothetical protein